jgi:branched-chain amino acid transport system ATP-binding protein
MLDEPSLGLSPDITSALFRQMQKIATERRLPLLVVEQKVREILAISHRAYSLKLGRVVYDGPSGLLAEDHDTLRKLFL